jgi:CRP/FNR family transcriptional regulator
LLKQLNIYHNASDKMRREIEKHVIIKTIPAGEIIATSGSDCPYFFIVVSGAVRVYRFGKSGREVNLYHVQPNQSCVLLAFCVLSHSQFPAFAATESETVLALLPSAIVREWNDNHEIWRQHMVDTLSLRVANIIDMVESMVAEPLKDRITAFLKTNQDKDGVIATTHQRIADELNASRVAISRILKEMADAGQIEQQRSRIKIHF